MAIERSIQSHLVGVYKRRKHFKRKNAYADAFDAADMPDMAAKLRACQEREVLVCCKNCTHTFWVVNRCRQRTCPLCSFDVSKQRARFLQAMTREMKHPKMLTLTMKLWRGDPHEGIKYLRQAFSKLRRQKVFKNVVGGAYQIELKEKSGGWHIHMHILLESAYLPRQLVFSAWKKIVDQSYVSVDIRAARDEKAIAYVVKYAAKSASFDTSPQSIVAWYKATFGERLFATFGRWYNAKIEDLDDPNYEPPPEPVCPHCGEAHSLFLARDGPMIYGHEIWNSIESVMVPDGIDSRPIPGVGNCIAGEEPPAVTPKEEVTS